MPAKKKTTKKASARKAKGKRVDSLSQAHGKEEKYEPTTLDQIWGDTGMSKYKTLDVEEYEEQIKEYSKSELQAHAVKVGLIPVDNPTQLRKRLMTEFRKHASVYKAPIHAKKDETPVPPEVRKILNEGK
jgi:hypothetical protein